MSRQRQKRLRLGLGLVVCVCLAYTAGFGVYTLRNRVAAAWPATGSQEMEVFWEAWNHVEDEFIGEVPSATARTYAAIHASLALLDPHTVFVEPEPRALERENLRGAYGGIGAEVARDAQGRIVLDPYADSPAERAGLTAGSILLAVDGRPLADDATESDVVSALRGEIGSQVELSVKLATGGFLTTAIKRERIEVPSVSWRLETPEIGYVQVERFTERTDGELVSALDALGPKPAGWCWT